MYVQAHVEAADLFFFYLLGPQLFFQLFNYVFNWREKTSFILVLSSLSKFFTHLNTPCRCMTPRWRACSAQQLLSKKTFDVRGVEVRVVDVRGVDVLVVDVRVVDVRVFDV